MAVAFDAVASVAYSGVTSASVNLTASGSDRVAIASISVLGESSAAVSSVTYGGAAMTLIDKEVNTTPDGSANLYQYIAPATSSQTCQVNFAGSAYGGFGVLSFTGVDQTTPVSNFNGASGNDLSTATVTVTSASGEMVVDSLCTVYSGTAPSAGAGQTARFNQLGSFGTRGAGSTEAGASSVTMSWTGIGGGQDWAITAASLKEASGGTSVTVNPVAQAGTFNTNSIGFILDQVLSIAAQNSAFSIPAISFSTEQILAQTVQMGSFVLNAPTVSISISTTAGVNVGTFSAQSIGLLTDQILALAAQEAAFSIPAVTVLAGGDVAVTLTTPQTLVAALNTPGVVTDCLLDISSKTLTFVLNPATVSISTPTTGVVSKVYLVLGLR